MYKGILIAFEGIDGCGKSTIARMVYKEFEKKGLRAVFTTEPTDKSLGTESRQELAGKGRRLNDMTLQIFFTADRSEHVANLIKPKLDQGYTVITDRYYWSTVAYGTAMGLDMYWLLDMNSVFPKPDFTFWFKVSPEIAQKRRTQRSLKEKLEVMNIQRRVEDTYSKLSFKFAGQGWYVIDASKPIDDVFKQVMAHLNSIMG